MYTNINIIKKTVSEKSRKLSAAWTWSNTEDLVFPRKYVLTEEEKANLTEEEQVVWRELKSSNAPVSLEDEMAAILSAEIVKEINNELTREWTSYAANRR